MISERPISREPLTVADIERIRDAHSHSSHYPDFPAQVSASELLDLCAMALASASPPPSEPEAWVTHETFVMAIKDARADAESRAAKAEAEVERLSAGRDAVLDQAAQAAKSARLPRDYQWGHDAMEQFEVGKRRAAKAVLALKGSVAAASPEERRRGC